MKANDFIREYGLPLAETILSEAPSYAKSYFIGIEQYESYDHSEHYDDCVNILALQQLVKSHELVKHIGGLEKSKFEYENLLKFRNFNYERLKQAISDVESCGGERG